MTKKKQASAPTVEKMPLKMTQFRQRTAAAHIESPMYVVEQDAFGVTRLVRVTGVRITMDDLGKPDRVEILL